MAAKEPVTPLVFACYISRIFAANIELNVVIDFVIIDKRTTEPIVTITAIILAALNIDGVGDEMIDRNRLQ